MRVVDAIPEMVEHLDAEQQELARRYLIADLLVINPGTWVPASSFQSSPGHLGLLVLDGLLTRGVMLGKPLATELVGRADLLRPADRDGEEAPIPFDIAWKVLAPTRIAVLDPTFARNAAQWPSVIEFVIRGASNRVHSLAITMAVSNLRRVDTRVLVLFWYLADRWGIVRPDGVLVPLKLTHETLARLVGAQRPSVTTALRNLAAENRLERMSNRAWLLRGPPPTTLERLRKPVVAPPDLAEVLEVAP